jgi:pilus assembly protein TadC
VGAIDARVTFRAALGAADLDPGDAVAVILDVLKQGHLEGDAVAGRLEHLSVDYRRIALSRDQAAARRLSVRILFPMVLCMLPAFALLTIVPLLVASLNPI